MEYKALNPWIVKKKKDFFFKGMIFLKCERESDA